MMSVKKRLKTHFCLVLDVIKVWEITESFLIAEVNTLETFFWCLLIVVEIFIIKTFYCTIPVPFKKKFREKIFKLLPFFSPTENRSRGLEKGFTKKIGIILIAYQHERVWLWWWQHSTQYFFKRSTFLFFCRAGKLFHDKKKKFYWNVSRWRFFVRTIKKIFNEI